MHADSTKVLRNFVDRIEKLEEEKSAISEQIAYVYKEAKTTGINPKAMRRLIRERKRNADEVAEEESDLETYRSALGHMLGTPLADAALARVAG